MNEMERQPKSNPLKVVWNGILCGLARMIYFFWTIGTKIMYCPKVIYEDRAVKEILKKEPCILIANHTSHSDGSFVPQALPGRNPYVLVTRKWYDKKAINWLFRNLCYIPINLNDMDNEWMEKCETVLRRRENVLIFPEGQLSKDGKLGEFQPGFLMLARHTDAKVIPMVIRGGYRKFHRQKLVIGSVLEMDVHQKGRPSVILMQGAQKCRESIQEMLDRYPM